MTGDSSQTPASDGSQGLSPPGKPDRWKAWAAGTAGAAAIGALIWGTLMLSGGGDPAEPTDARESATTAVPSTDQSVTTTPVPEFGLPYAADDPLGDVVVCNEAAQPVDSPGADMTVIEVMERTDSGASANEYWVKITISGPTDDMFSSNAQVTVTDPVVVNAPGAGFETNTVSVTWEEIDLGPPVAVVAAPDGLSEIPAIVTPDSITLPLPPMPEIAEITVFLKTVPVEGAEPVCDLWMGSFSVAATPALLTIDPDPGGDLIAVDPLGDQTVCGDPDTPGEGPGDIAGAGLADMAGMPYLFVSLPGTPILMDSPYDFVVDIEIQLPAGPLNFTVSRVANALDFHMLDFDGNPIPIAPDFAEGRVGVPLPERIDDEFDLSIAVELGLPDAPRICDSAWAPAVGSED